MCCCTTDLKLILMSSPLMRRCLRSIRRLPHRPHPGFTFPVEELFLEDILEKTGFRIDSS